MPIIKRFACCVLRINFNDHAPPHFHVLMNDGREVLVRIDSRQIMRGNVPRRELSEVLDWAADNQASLMAMFEEYRQ